MNARVKRYRYITDYLRTCCDIDLRWTKAQEQKPETTVNVDDVIESTILKCGVTVIDEGGEV